MKQISFFTRGTMAALTKEEGSPLSRSASSHPTSVPRINPFHLSHCGDSTSEMPNKGGRKPSPCTGGGGGGVGRGSGLVSLFSCLTVAILSRQPLSRQDRAHWGCPDTVCPWLQGDPQVW